MHIFYSNASILVVFHTIYNIMLCLFKFLLEKNYVHKRSFTGLKYYFYCVQTKAESFKSNNSPAFGRRERLTINNPPLIG